MLTYLAQVIRTVLPRSRKKQAATPIFIARTAHASLLLLQEREIDWKEPNGTPDAMQQRFLTAGWATRRDTIAHVQSGTGVYGRYAITDNGHRILREAKVVRDTHPEAVGLH